MLKKFLIVAALLLLGIATAASYAGSSNTATEISNNVSSVPVKMTALPGVIQPNGTAPGGSSPGGIPPMGSPLNSSGGMPPGSVSSPSSYTFSGDYMLDGANATKMNTNYSSDKINESAIYVTNGGDLTLVNPTITTSSNTSSNDASSFYGLNAAVLATSGSKVEITGGSVTTTGTGANGVFATGKGTTIKMTNLRITCSGDGGHGVDATLGGALNLTHVDINTSGSHGAAIATDRGSGTITATYGRITTYGKDSPGIYSTGAITVSDVIVNAIGAEAAVIEGANSINLENTSLTSGLQTTGGIMIYQSFSGDAENGSGDFTMNGGSISVTFGPVFFVTNTNAVIRLNGVNVTSASGTLIKAAATDRWGRSGSNGGIVSFAAYDENLSGSLACDNISSIKAILQNGTVLAGSINAGDKGKFASLALDMSSTWNVTGTSYLASLEDGDTALTNIHGNGFTVYYDSNSGNNSWLGGKTYSLANGGKLTPKI
jgi:hypothetical protein